MILKETGCQILIGQNGIVLLNCKDREVEQLVVQVLHKIESEAHTTGLTNRVYEYIKEMKEKSKK
jgi:exosome complex component RRP4